MGDIMRYDKIINVAIAKSRQELNYVNKTMLYSEFIDKYIKNTNSKIIAIIFFLFILPISFLISFRFL